MNLHALVSPAIGTVNPFVSVTIYQSSGATLQPNGDLVPGYAAGFSPPDKVQLQQLTFKDLQQVQGMNLTGVLRVVYLNGAVYGVERGAAKGGDKFVTQDGATWLVVAVPEQWPDWCRAILQLQVAP